MKIAIVGVGGVGGYFGAKICKAMGAPEAEVFFVARGAHLQAIRQRGLTVRTSTEGVIHCHPAMATDMIEELPHLDACLICVKSFDLREVTGRLSAKVSDTSEIVPLLNGIDIGDRIRQDIRHASIFPACVFVGTHVAEPGVVSQDGGACRILFGNTRLDGHRASTTMSDVFTRSKVNHEWKDDVEPSIWTKYVFIASFGLVTACFGKTLGQVMRSTELSLLVRSVMDEIVAIAKIRGVSLSPSVTEESYNKGNEFPADTKTSFQRDFELPGRPDERDLFGGTIIRLGRQLGVPTPRTAELYSLINEKKRMPG